MNREHPSTLEDREIRGSQHKWNEIPFNAREDYTREHYDLRERESIVSPQLREDDSARKLVYRVSTIRDRNKMSVVCEKKKEK